MHLTNRENTSNFIWRTSVSITKYALETPGRWGVYLNTKFVSSCDLRKLSLADTDHSLESSPTNPARNLAHPMKGFLICVDEQYANTNLWSAKRVGWRRWITNNQHMAYRDFMSAYWVDWGPEWDDSFNVVSRLSATGKGRIILHKSSIEYIGKFDFMFDVEWRCAPLLPPVHHHQVHNTLSIAGLVEALLSCSCTCSSLQFPAA